MSTFKVLTVNRHRLATDGKGVTSLVALAGCPLSCKYCINMDVFDKAGITEYEVEKLWDELSIDYCYFVATGGGVTFGGGEPLLQADAIADFLKILPERVTVNFETSLNVSLDEQLFKEMMSAQVSFIIDIKSMDKALYQEYTGLANDNVMENLKMIEGYGYQDNCKIRIPNIPDMKSKTMTKEDEVKLIKAMGFNNIEQFDYVIKEYMI